jgi:UvrD-like helicase C-terminal domain
MHRCGVCKHHGHSVRSLTKAIFTLPFIGKNFFRGIVLNSQLPFGKDAAYEVLKGETYNWRVYCLAWAYGCLVFLIALPATSANRCSSSMTALMTGPAPSGWNCSPVSGITYQPLFERLSDAHHMLVGWYQLSVDGFCHESATKTAGEGPRFHKQIQIQPEAGSLSGACLVARTNNLLSQYQNALHEKGAKVYPIRRSEAEDRSAAGVRLATMHRVKGLEFDYVIVAGVNDGIIPLDGIQARSSDPPTVTMESEINERALLYVSATRSKKEVLVTSFGKPSRFIES